MTEANVRQAALAKHIGQTYCRTDKLVPLGTHGSLSIPPMPLRMEIYADERLCDVPWWVVADRIGNIDHAWLFGWPDHPHEPWGMITEPYIDAETAQKIVRKSAKAMPLEDWDVEFCALTPEQGTWNPPSCIPIVSISRSFVDLIRSAIPIALGVENQ